jgi:hypothetical protein
MDGFWSMFCLFVVVVSLHKALSVAAARADAAKLNMLLRMRKFKSSFQGHCCKVSDEAAFCLIQRPYISKTLLAYQAHFAQGITIIKC